MSVAAGREFLAIPGPTVIPDAVLAAMHRPAIDIYSGPMVALTDGLLADLRKIFRTKGRAYIYAANGHGAWEAALTNVLSRGDKVLVLESGALRASAGARRPRCSAPRSRCCPAISAAPCGRRRSRRGCKADAKGEIKAILVAQIDTGSGVVNDIKAIGEAIRAAGHDALLHGRHRRLARLRAVRDGCLGRRRGDGRLAERPDDAAGARLCRRVAARPRAHHKANMRTPYWDWTFREGEAHYQKYCGTPPEQLLFGLRAALDLMFAEGLENVFARHRLLAEATRRAVAVWAEGQAHRL